MAGASLTPKNVLVLIVVHGLELVTQWEKEIKAFDPKANLTICDSNHDWGNLAFITSQFYRDKEKKGVQAGQYSIPKPSKARTTHNTAKQITEITTTTTTNQFSSKNSKINHSLCCFCCF